MTDTKKNSTSSKSITSKQTIPAGQSFDIIPRSQVRPTVTARPVLTPTKPEQADNTLQTTTQAATSQLKHGTLKFTPSAPVSGATDSDPTALLDQVDSLNSEIDKTQTRPELATAPVVVSKHQPDVVADEDPWLEAEAGDKVEDKVEALSVATSEASTEATSEVATEVASQAKHDYSEVQPPQAAKEIPTSEKFDVMAQAEKTPVSMAPEIPDAPAEAAEGSLDRIFKEDKQQTIVHSQALKDELQNIDDKPEEGVHPHHELYGGKPVIVIHKAHSPQATLNMILWIIFCFLLALVIVDVLLDSGVITTDYNVPHTRLLQ